MVGYSTPSGLAEIEYIQLAWEKTPAAAVMGGDFTGLASY